MSDPSIGKSTAGIHGAWSNRLTFILAATGSAVGLGNIWKFPYIAGENGGGAFVHVYLVCILAVGIPVMIAEVLMGRRGRSSPIHTVAKLSKEAKAHPAWTFIGGMGVVAGFLILSYYSVVAGWALAYVPKMMVGIFNGIDGAGSGEVFEGLLASPGTLLGWHSLFMLLTMFVVVAGVTKGLGVAVRTFMPLLFVLLLIVLGFSMAQGDFEQAFSYLFSFDASRLSFESVLIALGHAFFTLSLGMGAIMAYGAYTSADTPIGTSVLTIAFLDTAVALVAGMTIFPMVFSSPDIVPSEGPGLLFISLPVAFGNMPAGMLFGTLFFGLVSLAAWSSSISLIEPAVAWVVEKTEMTRLKAGVICGVLCWLLGIGSLLSFNHWSDAKLLGKFTFFDFSDFLTANVMLPVGGVLIAIFVGFVMNQKIVRDELGADSGLIFKAWRFVLRWVSTIAVSIIFIEGISGVFFDASPFSSLWNMLLG